MTPSSQSVLDHAGHAPTLPFQLPLELSVADPDTIAELSRYPDDASRSQFALSALRIGVLALRQAQGQVDADVVRREGDRLMESLKTNLSAHSQHVHQTLTNVLRDYFDPESGRFQERVQRLVSKDGELSTLLQQQIGGDDSQLTKTLVTHFGAGSQLMKLLAPDQSQGILAAMRKTLDQQLMAQREHVLSQFSLDNDQGALARLVKELTQRQGHLSEQIHTKIDEVVKEFSLDEEESALSRLVRNVDRAQRTITSEFSLDDESSALARLKREMLSLMKEQHEKNNKFQEEVKGALQAMEARRSESEKSTRHGRVFEDAVFEFVQHQAQNCGDVATHTGDCVGRIKNCKIGDCVVELGADSQAPRARVVLEAKGNRNYSLAAAIQEIKQARKNRDGQHGIFVFSSKAAPEGLAPFARYGDDLVVVWNAEDPLTDVYLGAALTTARALCVRSQRRSDRDVDLDQMEKAILDIEKRAQSLDEIRTSAETIHSATDKILQRVRIARIALERQVATLQDQVVILKDAEQQVDGSGP